MGSNIKEFSLGLDKFAAETEKTIQIVTQKIALEALRRVVLKTPVRSGRARGNWQTTLDGPSEAVTETTDKAGNVTISQGASVIGRVTPFGAIYLSNNLSYIGVLEDGSSKQAPAGMVAVTIVELEAIFG